MKILGIGRLKLIKLSFSMWTYVKLTIRADNIKFHVVVLYFAELS